MKLKLSLATSLEFLSLLICLGVLYKTFEQSVLEHHFIIPTQILSIGVLLGNFVYYSFKGHLWAKIILFWLFALADFCAFLSIFYSPSLAKTEYGVYFMIVFVPIFTFLVYSYQKKNELFNH